MTDDELRLEGQTWGWAAASAALRMMRDAESAAEVEAIAGAMWEFLDEHVQSVAGIAGGGGAALFEEVATSVIEEVLAVRLTPSVSFLLQ